MPTQRQIAVEFWTSRAIRPLSPYAKLLCNYLMTGPQASFIGIYRFSWDQAQDDLGLTMEEISAALELSGRPQVHDGDPFLKYDPETRVLWVVKRAAREFPTGNLSKKQRDGIRRMLDRLPPCAVLLQACDRYRYLGEPFSDYADKLSQPRAIPAKETRTHVSGIPLSPECGYPIPKKPDTPPDSEGPDPEGPDPASGSLLIGSQKKHAVADPASPGSPDKSDQAEPDGAPADPVTRPTQSGQDVPEHGTRRSDQTGAPGPSSAQPPHGGKETEEKATRPEDPKALKVVLTRTQAARARSLCGALESLPRKVRDFHPWAFLQKCISQGLPGDEALKILVGMQDRWSRIVDPWAYAAEVLRREYAQYRIDLQIQAHERTKREPARVGEILAEAQRRAEEPEPSTDEAPWP